MGDVARRPGARVSVDECCGCPCPSPRSAGSRCCRRLAWHRVASCAAGSPTGRWAALAPAAATPRRANHGVAAPPRHRARHAERSHAADDTSAGSRCRVRGNARHRAASRDWPHLRGSAPGFAVALGRDVVHGHRPRRLSLRSPPWFWRAAAHRVLSALPDADANARRVHHARSWRHDDLRSVPPRSDGSIWPGAVYSSR